MLAAAAPQMLTPAHVVALVKATAQLEIDASVSSSAFDSKAHPYVEVRGVPEGETVGGFLMSERAHEGALAGREDVLIVPLESGGSGGVFTQIVFARGANRTFAYAGHSIRAVISTYGLRTARSWQRCRTTDRSIPIAARRNASCKRIRYVTEN